MPMTTNQHFLLKLMEEASEVQKECSKCILFGHDNLKYNSSTTTNANRLEDEIADLLASVDLLVEMGILNSEEVYNQDKIDAKKKKVLKYLAYSQDIGLTDKDI